MIAPNCSTCVSVNISRSLLLVSLSRFAKARSCSSVRSSSSRTWGGSTSPKVGGRRGPGAPSGRGPPRGGRGSSPRANPSGRPGPRGANPRGPGPLGPGGRSPRAAREASMRRSISGASRNSSGVKAPSWSASKAWNRGRVMAAPGPPGPAPTPLFSSQGGRSSPSGGCDQAAVTAQTAALTTKSGNRTFRRMRLLPSSNETP